MKWPKDGKPASFSDLVEPICEVLQQAYSMRRRKHTDIKWTGLPQGESCGVCSLEHDERLTAENLAYSLDNQDRNALIEIISMAVQLGIEQGERMFKNSTCYQLEQMRINFIENEYKLIRKNK